MSLEFIYIYIYTWFTDCTHVHESRTSTGRSTNPSLLSLLSQNFIMGSYQWVTNSYMYMYTNASRTARPWKSHKPQQGGPHRQSFLLSALQFSRRAPPPPAHIYSSWCISIKFAMHIYKVRDSYLQSSWLISEIVTQICVECITHMCETSWDVKFVTHSRN